MRARELRADVVDVVRHAPQDRIHDRLGGIAAARLVPVQLLDPLQVDDRHDADREVGVTGDVHVLGDDGPVQALVEHQVGAFLDALPGRKCSGRLLVGFRLALVVQVMAGCAAAGLAIGAEQFLELLEQVRRRSEMTEMIVAAGRRLRHLRLHLGPVVAVEGIALHDDGVDLLAPEDPVEGAGH